MQFHVSAVRVRVAFFLLALAACGDSPRDAGATPTDPDPDPDPQFPELPDPAPAGERGSIAYVKGDELRVIEPDGSGDRLVFALSDARHSITGLSWRPDGGEIAFASDHEMATSFYERDIYVIRPDGSGLRKLTNPPTYDRLDDYPQGTVTVTVQNATFDAGPYFVYVLGAELPQQVTIDGASSLQLTFENVADLGDDAAQPVVVVNGIQRWWNAAAVPDVKAGQSVQGGSVTIGANPLQHFGADAPFWRADASAVGFIGLPTCLLQYASSDPSAGASYQPLVDPAVYVEICAVDWGPHPSVMDQLLIADPSAYTENGQTSVYRITEGSDSKGEPLITFDDYVRVIDLRWLPDGSGFIVARQTALLDESINLYHYDFASETLTQLTAFTGSFARRFAISPDGESIVFERVTELSGASDLWVMGVDGSDPRLLVTGGEAPAW